MHRGCSHDFVTLSRWATEMSSDKLGEYTSCVPMEAHISSWWHRFVRKLELHYYIFFSSLVGEVSKKIKIDLCCLSTHTPHIGFFITSALQIGVISFQHTRVANACLGVVDNWTWTLNNKHTIYGGSIIFHADIGGKLKHEYELCLLCYWTADIFFHSIFKENNLCSFEYNASSLSRRRYNQGVT